MRRIVETKEVVNAFTDYKTNKLVLVERNATGDISYKSVASDYSSFVKKDSLTPDLERMLRTSADVLGFTEDKEYYRIRWKDHDSRKWANENLPKKHAKTYDGDVSVVRRFLTDTGVKPGKPRSVFLDIETDSKIPFSQKENARILCWVLVDPVSGEVYKGLLDEDTDEAEQWLLVRFWQVLQNYDQVLAWNGDRFDFPMIKERSKRQGITVEPRRWLWLDFLELFKRMNIMAAASGEEKRSYTLNAVANSVLGHGKLEFDSSKTREAYDNATHCADGKCMKCRQCLLDYCVQDTVLMPEIEAKKGFINVFHTLCDVCSVFADSYGINPSVQVEGFLRSIAKEKGFKFVTRLDRRAVSTDQYKGAFVMHPVRAGMNKNVHVCDFASLYPSIIITWNISPETKVSEPTEYCCVAPITNRYFDISKEGILPFAVNELIRLRKYWQEREKQCAPNTPEWHEAHARSTAYKIAANSFYGVVGSPMSPFFDRDVAEAVTQCGVWLIQNVIYEASKRDMPALAGDTDSAFVTGPTKEKFADFVFNYCNGVLIPRLVDACGCRENRIKLDYDKAFERLFVPIDKRGTPVSKKYCGRLMHSKGKDASDESEPEIKGLEYKRGDSSRIAGAMQKEIIDLLCKKRCEVPEELAIVVSKYKERVLSKKLELTDVEISKRLSKELSTYAQKPKLDGSPAASPPHVTIARLLESRGREVGEGTKVSYVVVDGSTSPMKVIPAEDWTGEYDSFDLWESVVWPPTQRIIAAAFPDYNWAAFDKVRPQKSRRQKAVDPRQTDLIDWLENHKPAAV